MREKTLSAKERYKTQFINSLSEMNSIRHFWEVVQSKPGADFEFFNLIVQTRPNVILPCVIELIRDELPIAMLVGRIENARMPIRLGYFNLAKVPVRQLVFIAGGFMGEKTEDNLQRLLSSVKSLMIEQQIDLVIFEQLRVDLSQHEIIAKTFGRTWLVNQGASKHWLLRLPATWDDFLKSRRAKHRYWLRRLPKILDRDFNGKWNIQFYSTPDQAREFINAAELVAQTTYQRGLGAGFRRDQEFLQRLDLDAKRGRLRGYVLYIKDEPKAFWYCFTYKRTLYLAATGYDSTYRKYEIGTILLMKVLQDHCGTKIECVDFGLGDAGYKQRFASDHFMENSIYVFSSSVRGFCLYGFYRAMVIGTRLAKKLLDRLSITQRVKTYWRRKL